MTSELTSVRSISDLPDPVAPTTRPCGPMPPCADSLRSSTTVLPVAPTPIGTRRRSRRARARHVRTRSSLAGSATPRMSGRPTVSLSPSSLASSIVRRSAESTRAMAAATPSGGMSRVNGSSRESSLTEPSVPSSMRSLTVSGSWRAESSSDTTCTPRAASGTCGSGDVRCCPGWRPSPSTITTRCEVGPDDPPRERCARSSRASSSAARSSVMAGTSDVTRRAGRSPSSALADCRWGSHLIQSHAAAASSERTRAISTS